MNGSMLLPEFDHEFAETRKALERIPEDKLDWKPHEKSFSLHALSGHLAEIPNWMRVTLEMDVFDLDAPYERVVPETKEEILSTFDAQLKDAREALARASGETMMETWSMKKNGEVVMSMPKGAVLRSFIFNHNVHHRAQLGVYLRMLDVPVPGHYGPTADEPM
ncbi:MAG: DinB family protein [Gemmatimonadota bacterium]|nr:DinB family protein [Gemmatimonadota bacterium]